MRRSSRSNHSARAFTLAELLVATGIIVVLLLIELKFLAALTRADSVDKRTPPATGEVATTCVPSQVRISPCGGDP